MHKVPPVWLIPKSLSTSFCTQVKISVSVQVDVTDCNRKAIVYWSKKWQWQQFVGHVGDQMGNQMGNQMVWHKLHCPRFGGFGLKLWSLQVSMTSKICRFEPLWIDLPSRFFLTARPSSPQGIQDIHCTKSRSSSNVTTWLGLYVTCSDLRVTPEWLRGRFRVIVETVITPWWHKTVRHNGVTVAVAQQEQFPKPAKPISWP